MARRLCLWAAILTPLHAGAAIACDAGQTRHFACTFSNGTKAVEICHDAARATYAFGPPATLDDLRLSVPVTEVRLTPWPGIGRTIWEEVRFMTDGHGYTVYASIERHYPESDDGEITVTQSGGIIVSRGDTQLAHLTCDPGSVDFPWSHALFDAKEAQVQCYDRIERSWAACD